jgi:hypothetical protein
MSPIARSASEEDESIVSQNFRATLALQRAFPRHQFQDIYLPLGTAVATYSVICRCSVEQHVTDSNIHSITNATKEHKLDILSRLRLASRLTYQLRLLNFFHT